jgi:hypothetical protein
MIDADDFGDRSVAARLICLQLCLYPRPLLLIRQQRGADAAMLVQALHILAPG